MGGPGSGPRKGQKGVGSVRIRKNDYGNRKVVSIFGKKKEGHNLITSLKISGSRKGSSKTKERDIYKKEYVGRRNVRRK